MVIDATTLMLLLQPDAGVPVGLNNCPVDRPKERIEYLIQKLEKAHTKVVIPTPALSEVLVRVTSATANLIVEKISKQAVFRIEPFGTRAAIEVAEMTRNAVDGGNKPRKRDDAATWAKLKYDRQIVATALVVGAKTIYSDDRNIRGIAQRVGLTLVRLAELDLPPEDAQIAMDFEPDQIAHFEVQSPPEEKAVTVVNRPVKSAQDPSG